ncbi:MAG: hypothetical protein WDN69_04315 [Aliidongia sp.]
MPPRAQAAHQQASHLYRQMRRLLDGKPLEPFQYRDFGSLVSLGEYSTVGNLMGSLVGGSLMVRGLFRPLHVSVALQDARAGAARPDQGDSGYAGADDHPAHGADRQTALSLTGECGCAFLRLPPIQESARIYDAGITPQE